MLAPPKYDLFHAGPGWYVSKKGTEGAPLQVAMAIVREDVWQAMANFPQSESVSVDCLVCGQQSWQHLKGRKCPGKSINGKLFKKHPKGSTYKHGSVFPKGVPHKIVPGSYGEVVWYGLDAYKHVTNKTWAQIVEHFREKTPREQAALNKRARAERRAAGDVQFDTKMDALDKKWKADRKKEQERIAKLPVAERRKLRAEQKVAREKYAAERKAERDNPVFGDFLIGDLEVKDCQQPGAWIFRDHVAGVVSVSNHLSMLLADRKVAPAGLLDAIAELSAVTRSLHQARKRWEPSTSIGAQYPEWDMHLRHGRMLVRIAQAEIDRQNESKYRDAEEPLLTSAPMSLNEIK